MILLRILRYSKHQEVHMKLINCQVETGIPRIILVLMGLSGGFLLKDDRRTYKQNNPNEIVAIDGMSYMLTLEYTPTNAS